MDDKQLIGAICRLRKEKNAVILAHYYVDGEIQDIADFTGDSLELARKAASSDADIIVFCGVHFMAETAAVLCPGKKVLTPVPGAGCSLADSIKGEDLRRWKSAHPDGVIISYVNTTADTKACTDICCTSANAIKVVQAVMDGRAVPVSGDSDGKRPILFCPDSHLGTYINSVLGAGMEVWNGCCYVHHRITSVMVKDALRKYPRAEILIHPESDCSMDRGVVDNPRCFFYSTSGIIKHVKQSPLNQFVIATENGVLHRIRKECPQKEIIPINENAICTYMKRVNLKNLHDTLLSESNRVTVPAETASRALLPIKRMLAL